MRLSERLEGVAESATLRLFAQAARLRARGVDVVSLLEGESDLPAPAAVVEAARRSLARGETRYSQSSGLPELRRAIARKLRRENAVRAAPEDILVTHGAKQAIFETLQALCSPGDEVVIAAPCWATFPHAARLAGARPVLALSPGLDLDVDAVGRALTRRSRVVVINTPNNPTGAVYSRAALRALAALADRRGLFVLSDEAYEKLVYDSGRHVSFASVSPAARRRAVTVQTFSKSFSMTGFRVGYLAASGELGRGLARIHSHMTGNVAVFAQRAALAALALPESHGSRLRAVYEKRRDLACALAAPLFPFETPAGGFFLFADARPRLGRRWRDDAALAEALLSEARVAAVPGSACGRDGFLRLSFSGSEAAIREGFKRLAAFLA
jgi:aspartate aminotransferase